MHMKSALLTIALLAALTATAGAQSPQPNPPKSDVTIPYGRPGVTANHGFMRRVERSDGTTSFVFGKKKDEAGRIVGPHGHVVKGPDGKTDYARTQSGRVVIDTKRFHKKK
jgi:hypothetical protein